METKMVRNTERLIARLVTSTSVTRLRCWLALASANRDRVIAVVSIYGCLIALALIIATARAS